MCFWQSPKTDTQLVAADKQSGTTLLELLVTLALLALISVYALSAIRSWRNFSRIQDDIEQQALEGAIKNHIRRSIEGARPIFVTTGDDRDELAFNGRREDILLVTDADPRLEYGGLYLVKFELANDPAVSQDLRRLITFRQAFRSSSLEFPGDPIVLAENIRKLEFGYYGSFSEAEMPEWHDEWPASSRRLPQAIRFTLELGPESTQSIVVNIPAAR